MIQKNDVQMHWCEITYLHYRMIKDILREYDAYDDLNDHDDLGDDELCCSYYVHQKKMRY